MNDYLREVTGADFSAKDFRTWAATTLCTVRLANSEVDGSERDREREVVAAVDDVASELGNTRSVCRDSYIHPEVIDGYLDGSLHRAWDRRPQAPGAPRGPYGPRNGSP